MAFKKLSIIIKVAHKIYSSFKKILHYSCGKNPNILLVKITITIFIYFFEVLYFPVLTFTDRKHKLGKLLLLLLLLKWGSHV